MNDGILDSAIPQGYPKVLREWSFERSWRLSYSHFLRFAIVFAGINRFECLREAEPPTDTALLDEHGVIGYQSN